MLRMPSLRKAAKLLILIVVYQNEIAWASNTSADEQRRSDYQEEAFSYVCSHVGVGITAPRHASLEDETFRWVWYYQLVNNMEFQIRYDGQEHLRITKPSGQAFDFELSHTADSIGDTKRSLLQFKSTDDSDLGGIYVRKALNASDGVAFEFVNVEHGSFYKDDFGARGYKKANYICAPEQQINEFSFDESPVHCEPKRMIFECRSGSN